MWRSMLISFALEIAAISAAVIISIITVDKLGAFTPPYPLPPFPRVPKSIQLVPGPAHSSTAASTALRVPARPFVMPNRVPTTIAEIHDLPEMIAAVPDVRVGDSAGGMQGDPRLAVGSGRSVSTPPPPPPPAKTDGPTAPIKVRIGGNVMEAKIVKRVLPVYPPLARQARISGTVRLEGVISRDGRIVNLQVVYGHPLLTPAALQAVSQWIYEPTLLNGQPVEVIAPIDVHFTLAQ
jgi:periplasmic protein TonB